MTTRRFLFVDTDLTNPPSPTGLPEGYAVITKTGHMFVIQGGVFKATTSPGTTVGPGLMSATGTYQAIGGVTTPFFATTTTTAPTGYQADASNDLSQTYGETTNPAPPAGATGYTAITPKTAGNPAPGFHVLLLDSDVRQPLGCLVTFQYRFDAPVNDREILAGNLELAFTSADLGSSGITLFKAQASTALTGANSLSNYDEWKDGSFYLPPAAAGAQNIIFDTASIANEGESGPSGRILLTGVYCTPFDVADTGTTWYDDSTSQSYLFEGSGWRWMVDPYTKAAAQRAKVGYLATNTHFVDPALTTDAALPFAATAVASPSLNVPTLANFGKLEPTTQYFYKVTSLSSRGESLPSNEQSVTIGAAGTTQRSADLSWAAVTGATGYRIYVGTTAGGEVLAGEVDATTLTFHDAGYDRLTAFPVPTVDTTSGSTSQFVRVPGLAFLDNAYKAFATDAGINNLHASDSVSAALSIKHSGATPDVTVQLVQRSRLTGTDTVLASQTSEDLTVGKYRGFSLTGAVRNIADNAVLDFLVRVKSSVDGTVTVRADSSSTLVENYS